MNNYSITITDNINEDKTINVVSIELEGNNLVVYGDLRHTKTFMECFIMYCIEFGQSADKTCWLYLPIKNIKKIVKI